MHECKIASCELTKRLYVKLGNAVSKFYSITMELWVVKEGE